MHYYSKDVEYVDQSIKREPLKKHLIKLAALLQENASYEELFRYGMAYLPVIRDLTTGIIDLERLSGYEPEVVGYFGTLSELPSLPDILQDVALEFATFANGNSVQQDEHYYSLSPEAILVKALMEIHSSGRIN